jgi:archaellum component FlaC
MPRKKSKNKDARNLEKLIAKSRVIRKNIDAIMAAFRRIERHISEMQENVTERRVRQQTMSNRLEELMKNMKDLDESIKAKDN